MHQSLILRNGIRRRRTDGGTANCLGTITRWGDVRLWISVQHHKDVAIFSTERLVQAKALAALQYASFATVLG